jgi:hypothetical protein
MSLRPGHEHSDSTVVVVAHAWALRWANQQGKRGRFVPRVNRESMEPVYAAAQRFVDVALKGADSLFTPGEV